MPLGRVRICSLCALALVAPALGCGTLMLGDDQSMEAALLKAATASHESVTLEIYWATLPDDASESLWSHLAEDRLPASLRARLAENGLRAGVFGSNLPSAVQALINPDGEGELDATAAESVLKQTGVWRRTRQLRPGDTIELRASELIASAPLLMVRDGELVGVNIQSAQAYYELEASPSADGRTQVRLTPEVRHGAPKTRWTPDQTGVISPTAPTPDAEVFTELAIEAPLSAGEGLLVTSLPNSGSRLGGYLHAETGDRGRRKAILIRVVQAPRTGVFAPEASASLSDE